MASNINPLLILCISGSFRQSDEEPSAVRGIQIRQSENREIQFGKKDAPSALFIHRSILRPFFKRNLTILGFWQSSEKRNSCFKSFSKKAPVKNSPFVFQCRMFTGSVTESDPGGGSNQFTA